ncbi:hypothetical protein V6N12_033974 [Hibiscus sabdariffa]|uniref:Uncharacterized protein n=1 Tax=Hibiscus sabdariffa TaxID=183260 RepID=A0ABR2A9K1_9ROSI
MSHLDALGKEHNVEGIEWVEVMLYIFGENIVSKALNAHQVSFKTQKWGNLDTFGEEQNTRAIEYVESIIYIFGENIVSEALNGHRHMHFYRSCVLQDTEIRCCSRHRSVVHLDTLEEENNVRGIEWEEVMLYIFGENIVSKALDGCVVQDMDVRVMSTPLERNKMLEELNRSSDVQDIKDAGHLDAFEEEHKVGEKTYFQKCCSRYKSACHIHALREEHNAGDIERKEDIFYVFGENTMLETLNRHRNGLNRSIPRVVNDQGLEMPCRDFVGYTHFRVVIHLPMKFAIEGVIPLGTWSHWGDRSKNSNISSSDMVMGAWFVYA